MANEKRADKTLAMEQAILQVERQFDRDSMMTRSKQEYLNLIFGANCSRNELLMDVPFGIGLFY